MLPVIYSMSVSLDGFIAGPDGDIGWTAPDVFAIVLGVWMVLYGVLLVISSILLSRVAHLSASGLWTT